jgi:hypothetical protein
MSDNPVTPISAGGVGLMRRLFGPAATELGEALADRVRIYRARNLKRILDKAEKEIGARPVMELPLRFSIPFIEQASIEDNETIADLWSTLLEQAAEELRDEHHLFVKILGNLTPNSVELLDWLVGEFLTEEDWYNELSWTGDWLHDLEKFVENEILPLCDEGARPEPGEIAQKVFEFEHRKPFWVFRIAVPVVMRDVRRGIDAGQDKEAFGQVIAPVSVEHSSLQILEREQLVVRRDATLTFKYCDIEITYAAVTALGAELANLGRQRVKR